MEPFFLIGSVIIIGFLGYFLYSKTQIPETLILIIVGLILGPITGVVPRELVMGVVPTFSTLALIIIIFDSGFSLDMIKIMREFISSFVFTVITVLLTVVFVSVYFSLLLGWQWQYSILLAIVTAGTTTITVMSIVGRMRVAREVKNLLATESIVNDIILIVAATTAIQFIKYETISLSAPMTMMMSNFSIGVVIGAVAGGLWLYVLSRVLAPHLAYIATLGIIFMLYDTTEWFGGSGAVASLFFSLILGNAKRMNKRFQFGGHFAYANELRNVNFNIAFFVRTFFFVMLGITFNAKAVTWLIFFYSIGLLALLLGARWVAAWMLAKAVPSFEQYRMLIATMMPRGLVAIVLAFLPVKEGIIIPYFTELVLIMIFTTTITANIGAIAYHKIRQKRKTYRTDIA